MTATAVEHWLLPATALALVPKCLACLAAYAGLGAAFGLGGPELCGATTRSPGSAVLALATAALAGALTSRFLRSRSARRFPHLPLRRRASG